KHSSNGTSRARPPFPHRRCRVLGRHGRGGGAARRRRAVPPGGGDRHRGALLVPVPAQGRRRLPRQGVLHLRVLHPRHQEVPQVRRHRRPRDAQARGRRLPRADLPRDDGRVGDRAGRPILVGPVLQGGDQPAEQLLRRHGQAVAVLPRQVLPWPRPHPNLMEFQLRSGGAGPGVRRAAEPGAGGQLLGHGVPDGVVVLDDAQGDQAVVPPGDGRRVPPQQGRRRREPHGRVRAGHQHRQRWPRVQRRRRRAGQQPDRLLPAVLPGPRRRRRAQPRLRAPAPVLARGSTLTFLDREKTIASRAT
uniref:Uncharacterized protein n=1 Tax=Aegilops tauschii subsp. strangulata TaxID=200361 RepID=A0A453EDA9_AEGTS